MRLLKSRAKSRARLEQALEARGFSAAEISEALRRVTELGYLDDGRYSEAKAASELKTGRSLDNVRRRLEAEGVDEDIAADAVSRAAQETGHDDLSAAKALVQKRKLTGVRAARFLASRGFSYELIERVVRLHSDE